MWRDIGGSFQAVCLLLLWVTIAWPLWSFLFSKLNYRILDMLPFVINCLSLTGNSYEGLSTDWRIWALNLLSPGPLAVASMLVFRGDFDVVGLVVISIACLVSLGGSLGSMRFSRKLTELFDIRITLVKSLITSTFFILAAWGISYLDALFSWSVFSAHVIVGIVGAYTSLVSLLYIPQKKARKRYGIGSPLLWLALRVLFSPGIPWFFLWSGIFVIGFIFLNLLQNRADFCTMCQNHWRAWLQLEQSNNVLSLVLALVVSLLVSNGMTKSVIVSPAYREFLMSTISSQWKVIVSGVSEPGCDYNATRILGFISSSSFPVERTYTHFMYEESASIVAVAFLILNSVACYLRRAFDSKSRQGYWQPVFFFVCGALIFFSQKSPDEVLASVESRTTVIWSPDAIIAAVAAFIGGALTIAISAFKIVYVITERGVREEALREHTLYARSGIESRRFEGLVLVLIMLAASILSVLAATSWSAPRELRVFPYAIPNFQNVSQYASNSSCFDNIAPGLSSIAALTRVIREPIMVGIPSMMSGEYAVLAVLFGLGTLFQTISIYVPEADEVVILFTSASGIFFTASVAFAVRELRRLPSEGTLFEWLTLSIGLLQFFASAGVLIYRLRLKPFDLEWRTEEEMLDAFACSQFQYLNDFVKSVTGYRPIADTDSGVFRELLELSRPTIVDDSVTKAPIFDTVG